MTKPTHDAQLTSLANTLDERAETWMADLVRDAIDRIATLRAEVERLKAEPRIISSNRNSYM